MALPLWISYGEEWLADEKVNFNGVTKEITVNEGVTALDIRQDVYSAWVRWTERYDNERYLFAMRFTGLDTIPGGQTGDTYFLINGWKLLYDPRVVAITGVLYSDDYATPYYFVEDGSAVFPATVSALVNTVTNTQNVISATTEEIAAQVRTELTSELAKIVEIALLHGLQQGSPLIVSDTSRTAGAISQSIATDQDGTTTVTRQ